MINVLILTEGGAKIGYGHMSRCLALSQAFNETRPEVDVKFIVRADKRAKAFLKSNNVNFVSLDWVKRLDKIQELIGKETIIIVDSYQAPQIFYKRLRMFKYKPYLAAIDDCNRIRYEADAIINFSVRDRYDIGYKKSNSIKYLVGNEYLVFRKEFYKKPGKRINKKIRNILISLSGADCNKLVTGIVNLLANYGLNLHVVSPDKSIHNLFNGSKIKVYSDLSTKDICSLMMKVDLCISGGGQILNELAYLGVPTIAICLARNQLENIKRWKKTGFLEYIGWHRDKDILLNLEKSLNGMGNIDVRKQRSKSGKNTADSNGRLKIVKVLLSHFYETRLTLRKADFRDALDIFNTSNDPLVRRISFDTRPIEWQHHVSWLKEKLQNNNCVFFVAGTLKEIYGQVRFDINPEKNNAVINISLNKNIRGLGLSSSIINRSVNTLFKMRKDVKSVHAFIKRENIPSNKSFKKANFKFSKNVRVKRNESKLYVYTKGQ